MVGRKLDRGCMENYVTERSRKWRERNEAVTRGRTEREKVSTEDIREIQRNGSIADERIQ